MMPMGSAIPRTRATPVERVIGAFIDGLMMVPVYFVVGMVTGLLAVTLSSSIIGFVGSAINALIAAAWFLMRDALGLSVGKKILGLEVLSANGGVPTQDQLKKRNLTLAGGSACGVVPYIGALASLAVYLYEAFLLFTKGERYGDQMAGTMVVKKAATPAA